MKQICLKTFLNNMFGYHDSVSGYGASYPVSRNILAFFEGRLGITSIITSNCFETRFGSDIETIKESCVEDFKALRNDLNDVVRQMDDLIKNTEEPNSHDKF